MKQILYGTEISNITYYNIIKLNYSHTDLLELGSDGELLGLRVLPDIGRHPPVVPLILNIEKNAVLRSWWSQNYLRPGAGAEINFLIKNLL